MQLHFNILAQLSSPEYFWKDNNVYLYIIHNNRGNGWYSSQLKLSSHYFSFCKLLLKLVCNSPRRSTKKMWKPWKVKVKSLSPSDSLGTRGTVAYQAPPTMGFSRQEYWSGLPFPSPGDLPDPGIEPGSPALQADSLPSEPPGKPIKASEKVLPTISSISDDVSELKWSRSVVSSSLRPHGL